MGPIQAKKNDQLTIKKRDVLIVNENDKNWWKVETLDGTKMTSTSFLVHLNDFDIISGPSQ